MAIKGQQIRKPYKWGADAEKSIYSYNEKEAGKGEKIGRYVAGAANFLLSK